MGIPLSELNLEEISMAEKIDPNITSKIVYNLNIYEKMILRLKGSIKIGEFQHGSWSGSLPFYLFDCPEHGYQINYASGYGLKLHCPMCLQERISMIENTIAQMA